LRAPLNKPEIKNSRHPRIQKEENNTPEEPKSPNCSERTQNSNPLTNHSRSQRDFGLVGNMEPKKKTKTRGERLDYRGSE